MNESYEDGRPSIPAAKWRDLSAVISPEIVAGLDVEGIDGLNAAQRRLMTPQKGFLIHKMDHAQSLATRLTALALYGELDRAVAGLVPLIQVPVGEYKIPHWDNMLYGIRSVAYFATAAQRGDLLSQLAPLLDAPAFYDPLPMTLSSFMLRGALDFDPEELERRANWKPAQLATDYVNSVTGYARGWIVGGSEEYPTSRLEDEIDRYSAAFFAVPGYAPYNENYYRGVSAATQ